MNSRAVYLRLRRLFRKAVTPVSKNTFNLGDYLKTEPVSKADTGREQIEYIPLDDIDPDPGNFYSLEGLDELAGNIELVGLQQPLRVRPPPSVGSADSSPKGGAKGEARLRKAHTPLASPFGRGGASGASDGEGASDG